VKRRNLARDIFLGLAIGFIALRLADVRPWDQSVDAYAYWSTRDGILYEGSSVGILGSYLYSPAFAHLLIPLTLLSWALFNAIWTAINCALLWYLAGRWSLLALLFLPIPLEIVSGNVHLIYAYVAVAGLRWPALWAIPLITKVTPGIGLLWFLVRREWRNLAIAMAATAAIVLISVILDQAAWREWIALLLNSDQAPTQTPGWYVPVPLLPRLVIAAILVVWGARTNRPWVLPVAMTCALPLIWLNGLAVLAGLLPAWRQRAAQRRETDSERTAAIASAQQA
jgi:hypothetical protein